MKSTYEILGFESSEDAELFEELMSTVETTAERKARWIEEQKVVEAGIELYNKPAWDEQNRIDSAWMEREWRKSRNQKRRYALMDLASFY